MLDNAETIEKSTKKNIMFTTAAIKRDSELKISITTGWKAWNRKHTEEPMTYEQYVFYRKQKEAKKEKEIG